MVEDTWNFQAPRELQVPQDRETGVQEIAAGPFRLRYLYARSSDTRQTGDRGQDYITLRYTERRLAFALCDGVSQSFYGDLAARFLGQRLVKWLWDDLPSNELRPEPIRQALHSHLMELTDEATRSVRRVSIPADAPPLLRDALEQKRAIGSEATFVCGVVEMPGPNLPEGRIVLAWLGDSELQLWGTDRDRTPELGAEWITARRWSTKVGPKGGDIGLFVGTLQGVQRVLAYSDGIASLRERLGRGIGDEELAREVERLGKMPTSDDVSFLEIEMRPEPATVPIQVALPIPLHLVAKMVDGRIHVSWDPVPGAETYELEWTAPTGMSKVRTVSGGTRWISSLEVQEGEHTFRVRALAGGQRSGWSAAQRLSVTIPAPPTPPRRRSWLVYAGAGAVFAVLCLVVALVGKSLVVKRTATPSPMTPLLPVATATATVRPTIAVSPTATVTQSPQRTPTPESPLPTPTPPVGLPQTPIPETPYRLSQAPPRVAPVEGESTPPEGTIVVVGGRELLYVEESGLYSLRVAQREVPESKVHFLYQDLPSEVSPDQVRWVWLIYRPQASSEPVVPALTILVVDGQELLWGPMELQEGQEAWVYGVNSEAGLCHFLAQGCPIREPGVPVLVKGSWRRHEDGWELQATEWYRFDPDKRIYVSVE